MKKIIITACILLVLAGITVGLYFTLRHEDKNEYAEVKVERGDLKSTVSTTGTITPQNRLKIKSTIAGRIEEVLVDEGMSVKKGDILVKLSSTDRAALLDAVRSKDASKLAQWEDVYKPMSIIAPIDGDIIARDIEPGQTVATSDSLLVMADRLIVQAQIDETDIGRVKVGQKAEFTLDAYPTNTITGHVDAIAYDATTVNNVTMYYVDILPGKVPAFMRSGMTANIQILTAETNSVLLLPADVVVTRDKDSFVRLVGPEHKEVKIVTGMTDGKKVEIKSGLDEGDVVLKAMMRLPQAKSNGRNPFSPFQKKK